MLHPTMCASDASVITTPLPPPFPVVLRVPLISRFTRLMSWDRAISNASVSSGPTIVAPPAEAPPGIDATIVIDRALLSETFSEHVPVTVMMLGPVWPIAASAALMLGNALAPPPGQTTVASAACAAAGSREKASKITGTGALNRRFVLKVMLLSFFEKTAESPYLDEKTSSSTENGTSYGPGPNTAWCG
jgi:hypothetical protein